MRELNVRETRQLIEEAIQSLQQISTDLDQRLTTVAPDFDRDRYSLEHLDVMMRDVVSGLIQVQNVISELRVSCAESMIDELSSRLQYIEDRVRDM
jgi:hypothetical protein